MPRRPRIETDLPDGVRRWLDRALADGNFSGYEHLEALLRDKGYLISKSAIHRYGAKLERRLAAVKASTEAMKLLDEAAGDEKDSRSGGLMATIQTELFETIVNLQEATDREVDAEKRVKLLSTAAKNIATMTRASIYHKRFQAEVRQSALKEAAETASSAATDAGATDEQVAFIRARILGIAERVDHG